MRFLSLVPNEERVTQNSRFEMRMDLFVSFYLFINDTRKKEKSVLRDLQYHHFE